MSKRTFAKEILMGMRAPRTMEFIVHAAMRKTDLQIFDSSQMATVPPMQRQM
uniref:Acyl-CoA dehydrogenase n=1 Tax=Ascaris lumbricoides TaxID=6252 RepID=A0A0M3HNI1_ASCLU